MYIKEDCKEKILADGDQHLQDVIESIVPLNHRGSQYVGKCPICGTEGGLEFNPHKKIFKCFHCDQMKGNSAVSFVMHALNCTYPEALEHIAKTLGISVEYEEPVKNKKPKNSAKTGNPAKTGTATQKDKKPETRNSFLKEFLAGSGITLKDIEVSRKGDNGAVKIGPTFKSGTIDSSGKISLEGNDVIIEYYDLDGYPVKFQRKDFKGRLTDEHEYYRIRWQYPDEHKDKDGKPAKYHSPYGSGTYIYIPDYIRTKYRQGETLDRLYIQEGEKKAEKACKHGIPSVAISGIMNIANKGTLSPDLIRIIQDMQVKEVVMLYDSDWNDLSKSIKITDSVDKRPRNFYYAAKNFRDHLKQLTNRGLYVECYIGHVLKNANDDKGIDDLLVNTLKGKEDELKQDLDYLINEKSLTGKYVQLYRISTWTDSKLEELWGLERPQSFAKLHQDILKELPEFRIGRHTWRITDKGEIESAQPVEDYEKFWIESVREGRDGNEKRDVTFDYAGCLLFLQNRGYGRFRRQNGVDFTFVRYEKPFLHQVDHHDIRDYVMDFAKSFTNRQIQNMLLKGSVQYLGPQNLSSMEYINPNFEVARRDSQLFYFRNYCWKITADNIEQVDYASIDHTIWFNNRRDYTVHRTAPLMKVDKKDDKNFRFELLNKDCQFLQFLINTSNFSWRKEQENITAEDLQENTNHLIAKLCAIGYMCMSYKDMSVARAVVAMDGKQSEVGQSNGRSGKSLLGILLKYLQPTVYINGKGKDPSEDAFYWDSVDETTKTVFIDDVRTNFSLEPLFAYITGDFVVNAKGMKRTTYPFSKSPKIYITTNHAINGTGSSYTDRQWKIAFSDFYNDYHKPADDFDNLFFVDWDECQWNLMWNLVAECVQLYLRYGVVQSPSERIEARQLRQQMGEMFLSWADEYFSKDTHRNSKLVRKEVYDDYLEYSNEPRKYASPTAFKSRIKAYCSYKGYIYNPQRLDSTTGKPLYYDKDGRPDMDEKTNGVEYILIGDADYLNKMSSKPKAIEQSLPLSADMEDFLNGK